MAHDSASPSREFPSVRQTEALEQKEEQQAEEDAEVCEARDFYAASHRLAAKKVHKHLRRREH